jgi:hypothetical protein
MKKKVFLLSLALIVTIQYLSAQESYILAGKQFQIGESPISVEFKENSIVLYDYESNKKDVLACKYENRSALSFVIILQKPKNIFYFSIDKTPTTWLVLYSEDNLLLIYNNENSKPLSGGIITPNKVYDFGIGQSFYPSSELKEGSTIYSASNLESLIIGHPWAMDDKKNGLGQYVKIVAYEKASDKKVIASRYKEVITDFWLSIGFVSFTKPYLYLNNSRPKKIKIEYQDGDFDIDLIDTPNLQHFKIPTKSEWIKLTILESFPGNKYTDCVINSCITRTWIIKK